VALGALGLECTVADDTKQRFAAWLAPERLLAEAEQLWPALSKGASAASPSTPAEATRDGAPAQPRSVRVPSGKDPSVPSADPEEEPDHEPVIDPTAVDWDMGGEVDWDDVGADEAGDAAEAEEPELTEDGAEQGTGERSDHELVSLARETWVYVSPSWSSRRLGYLRAGSIVETQPEPATFRKCRGGWYRLVPRGYVCVGSRASLDLSHPVALLSARRPDMTGLPYLYVISRFPPPPLYARLPTVEQQLEVEPKRDYHLRKHTRLAESDQFVGPPPPDPIPPQLQDGKVLPALGGKPRGEGTVSLGVARVKSAFGLLSTFEHEGRRFGLTTEMALLPLDRTRVVAQSTFHGVRLSDEYTLPVAFVQSRKAKRYRVHDPSGAFVRDGQTRWREAFSLTGQSKDSRGHRYLETADGSWLRADQVFHVGSFTKAPRWAKEGRKWIDVSILRQTLVAYEGRTPVYATLVSTGVDGLGDPDTTHSTVQGTFLIHTKHVSVTMDGDERGDEFDFRDVPFVQYFTEGYALHAAYWHDAFGTPRSHGCINLAPRDAAWLFGWTTPDVPAGWHAALSLKKGTVVHIHP
jgi:hypothetical protein